MLCGEHEEQLEAVRFWNIYFIINKIEVKKLKFLTCNHDSLVAGNHLFLLYEELELV